MVGNSFAHYEILAKLGEGGMGEVYQARDRRLQRMVALKILPKDAIANPDRRRRFEQEARAASALSHPNIVTIYDISQAEGFDYIAMEHVEGKPLHQVIGRKGLRVPEVLQYAVQIASALAAAHNAGIVHRDVKPANIMVTATRHVKLLDFGVAKLLSPDEPDEASSTQSLTVDLPNTEQGVILGTVAYMSPEQAEGRPIDCRSDIFSFGSVLYEMLTGRRAFEGETKLSTIMAIVQKEPRPVSEILGRAPLEIEKIVARCLRKDRERRLQHMDDVRNLLEELKEESDSGMLAARVPAAPPVRRRPRWRWALAGVAALAAAASALYWMLPLSSGKHGELVLTRLTSDTGVNGCATLSSDGKVLAYCSDRAGEENLDIWVRHLVAAPPSGSHGTRGTTSDPAFSPDGGLIAFRSERDGGGIYIVATLGGGERPVAPGGLRPRFSPDGKWLAYWNGQRAGPDGAIDIVPVGGGTPRRIQPEFQAARWPVWSPDGGHLLFWGMEKEKATADWFVAPVEGGPAIPTGVVPALRTQRLNSLPQVSAGQFIPGHWTPDGVYFAAAIPFGGGYNSNIFRLPLTRSFHAAGPAVRLTFGSDLEMDPYCAAGPAIVFSRYTRGVDVWGLPLAAGQAKPVKDLRRLTHDGLFLALSPSASRSGKLAYASYRTGHASLQVVDLASGSETQVAAGDQVGSPAVNPAGSKVAYTRTVDGKRRLEVVGSNGGSPRVLCEDCGWTTDWTSDGKAIAYRRRSAPGIGLIDAESGNLSELLVKGGDYLGDARFSPDGRWVAFLVRPGRRASSLRIARFRPGGSPPAEWIELTRGEQRDYLPAWAADSSLVYFLSDRDAFRCIWAQRIVPATGHPSGAPYPVRHLHSPRRSLMEMWDATSAGLSASPGRLVLSQAEMSGEIWMATWRQIKPK